MAGPATKYNFDGIGAASASLVIAALATSGNTWAVAGVSGTIFKWLLTEVFSAAASVGLVLMNVGAEKVEIIIDQNAFDGSWDSAEKLIDAARQAHQDLTPAQIAAIDAPVIGAFRKFASFARPKV